MSKSLLNRQPNVSLNVLRLFAASLVVIGHLRALMFVDFVQSDSRGFLVQAFYLFTSLGHPAVMVFFALSGYWVGGGAIRAIGRDSFTWREYLTARLTRLWLVLIPAVLLTQLLDRFGTALNATSGVYSGDPAYHTVVPIGGAVSFLGLPETLGNIFFVQSLWVSTIGTNTPLWSLAYELWFYVMFPAVLLVCSKKQSGRRRVIAGILLICAAAVAGPKVLLLFPIWIAGAAIAWQKSRICHILASLRPATVRLAQLIAVSITCSSAAASSYLDDRLPGSDYIVGAAALLMIAAYVGDDRGMKAPLYRVSQAANWSYSLYAYHLPILALIVSFVLPKSAGRWQVSPANLGMGMLVLAVVFLCAYSFSRITENQKNGALRILARIHKRALALNR